MGKSEISALRKAIREAGRHVNNAWCGGIYDFADRAPDKDIVAFTTALRSQGVDSVDDGNHLMLASVFAELRKASPEKLAEVARILTTPAQPTTLERLQAEARNDA